MTTMTLDKFREALVEQGKSERTVNGYVGDLQIFSVWFYQSNGEELRPDNLTPTDVKAYRAHLLTQAKAKPATINRRLAALRAYGEVATEMGASQDNPAKSIKPVKKQALAPKWLDKYEQAALVREAERRCLSARSDFAKEKARRDHAILILMLNTGLRIGELVDLETGDIVISERKGSLTVRCGKGEKARVIPLNANARNTLQAWYKIRPGINSQLVFVSKRGEGLQRRGIQYMIEEIGAAAKIEELSAHMLRHTFAKNLRDGGVGLETIAALLGHERLETTRRYLTAGETDLAKAVQVLED